VNKEGVNLMHEGRVYLALRKRRPDSTAAQDCSHIAGLYNPLST
jgi:hypothetical protein